MTADHRERSLLRREDALAGFQAGVTPGDDPAARLAASRCALLKVCRAAFDGFLADPSKRDRDDAQLAAEIAAVDEQLKGRWLAAASATTAIEWPASMRRAAATISTRGLSPSLSFPDQSSAAGYDRPACVGA